MMDYLLNEHNFTVDISNLWSRNNNNNSYKVAFNRAINDVEMQGTSGRRNSCRMLGDDLVENERRRTINAKRDTLQRQRRIEQIEAEIENEVTLTPQNTEVSDSQSEEEEETEPRTAAEWNRRIRKNIAKQNNESVEIPTINRVYTPTWVDILWAVIWFIVFLFVFGIFCYRFQDAFISLFKSFIEWVVYVYTVISQHIVKGFDKVGHLFGQTDNNNV